MQYFLNGGGREFDSLQLPEFMDWLDSIHVKKITLCFLAVKDQTFFKDKSKYTSELSNRFNVTVLTTYTLDEAEKIISNSDALFFSGGSQEILKERLEANGIVDMIESAKLKAIGGASAGEMLMGEEAIVGFKDVKKTIKGLGIIKNTIFDSHFSERSRKDRLKNLVASRGVRGIGIDENTWLILDSKQQPTNVFGSASVTIFHNDRTEVYDSFNQPN